MPRYKKVIVTCDKCKAAFEVSESFAKGMKFCPACSNLLKPSMEEIQQDIKFSVASFIDSYGMDFVIETIKSIKMEDGVNATEAIMNEYYYNSKK